MAEYSIEPWGELRTDVMISQLCWLLYTVYAKKGARKLKPTDFMPFYKSNSTKKLRATTPQEMESLLKRFAEAYGGQHRKSVS